MDKEKAIRILVNMAMQYLQETDQDKDDNLVRLIREAKRTLEKE